MIVRLGILLIDKVGIVSTHQFHAILLRQFYQHLVRLLLQGEGLTIGADGGVFHFMALQLQIVVVAPKTFVPLDGLTGTSDITLQNLRWHLSGDTG